MGKLEDANLVQRDEDIAKFVHKQELQNKQKTLRKQIQTLEEAIQSLQIRIDNL